MSGDGLRVIETREIKQHGGVTIRTVEDAVAICEQLKQCNLLPEGIKNGSDAFMIIMTGAELGLGPMASVRNLHIIKGKVTMSAELILARLLAQGVRATWIASTNDEATLRLERKGSEAHEESFTMADAKRAQLGGGSWQKYPKAMLRARCVSAAARAYAPDLMGGGGVYVDGELGDEPEPAKLSAVAADVRDDDPERFDAAKAEQAANKVIDEGTFDGWAPELDRMAAEGKRLAAIGEPSDSDDEMTQAERAALEHDIRDWLRDYALDWYEMPTSGPRKKAWARLVNAGKGCPAAFDIKAVSKEAVEAIKEANAERENEEREG